MTDYGRDMYRQLCEQTEKAERLEKENRHLRAEVTHLTGRIDEMTSTFEAQIEAAIAKAVKPLREEIVELTTRLENANDEIARLKASKNKDSGNSSKPPSSNGYRKVSNSREASGRKSGGQKGHRGHTIRIPRNIDELVAAGKAKHVVEDETDGSKEYVSDWEIDLHIIPIYRERRRTAGGKPPTVQYGAYVQSLAVYLQHVGMLSLERLSGFFKDITEGLVAPSEASLLQFSEKAASRIKLEPLVYDLLNGVTIHTDDTPVRTTQRAGKGKAQADTATGTTLSAYIRTYSNATTTLLRAHAHKDEEGIRSDGILTRFYGIVSHDHEAKFYHYGTKHATCGAHLCRELKGMRDLCLVPWADEVRRFFLEMNACKKQDQAVGKTACNPERLSQFENRYDELLAQGTAALTNMRKKSLGYEELRRMLNRLQSYKNAYLLFIRDYLAPFTNNQAERDLRHCKTKQKVSGCYRSWHGLQAYCRIRSLLDSTRKRGASVFSALLFSFASCSPAEQ